VQLIGRHSISSPRKSPEKSHNQKTMEINQTDSEQHESLHFQRHTQPERHCQNTMNSLLMKCRLRTGTSLNTSSIFQNTVRRYDVCTANFLKPQGFTTFPVTSKTCNLDLLINQVPGQVPAGRTKVVKFATHVSNCRCLPGNDTKIQTFSDHQ